MPLRKAENDLKGYVPAPGWDARYDWAGWLATDALPQARDPERGWIATANQRVVPDDYPHFLTSEWEPPYRQQRIEQLLGAKPKHSIDDLAAIQADVKSLAALEMLPWLQRAKSDHPLAAAAHKALEGFDGTMAADRAAPLILWAWQRQLTQRVFADEMGAALFERAIGGRTFRSGCSKCCAPTTPGGATTRPPQVSRRPARSRAMPRSALRSTRSVRCRATTCPSGNGAARIRRARNTGRSHA